MMIVASLPPHFWVKVVSACTYPININPSSALQTDIPLEHLFGCSLDYSTLHLFGCICYILFAPHECTKLTTQSVECVFLDYNDARAICVGILLVVGCTFLGM